MFIPFLNEIGRRCPGMIRRITLPVVGAIILVAAPAPRAQTSAPQGQKSGSGSRGECGKCRKEDFYERMRLLRMPRARRGRAAAQASGPRIGPPQRFLRSFINYVRQPTGQMPPFTTEVSSLTRSFRRHFTHTSPVPTKGHTVQGHSPLESIKPNTAQYLASPTVRNAGSHSHDRRNSRLNRFHMNRVTSKIPHSDKPLLSECGPSSEHWSARPCKKSRGFEKVAIAAA